MKEYKIYESPFYSIQGTVWKVELWRKLYSDPGAAVVVDVPDGSALVLEWMDTAKEDVVCGCAATLKLVSPGDRTFLDLYAERPDDLRLKVYRDGSPFWEGYIDPEFYEEPYSSASGYDVTLTFTDFGILDREKYNLSGMQTLQAILDDALAVAGFSGYGTDTTLPSTTVTR